MKGFLLDTNALLDLRRPAQNQRLVDCIAVQPSAVLYTSTVNVSEIRYGIELKQDPVERAELVSWLSNTVLPLFEDRVCEVSEEVLLRWIFIIKEGKARRHTFAHQDSLIAAVAAVHQLVVITADERHFVQAAVPVLDPWHSQYYDIKGNVHSAGNTISATLINDLNWTAN